MSKKFGYSAGIATILIGLFFMWFIRPGIPIPLVVALALGALSNLGAGIATIIAAIKETPLQMKNRYLIISLSLSIIGLLILFICQKQNADPVIIASFFAPMAGGSTTAFVWTMDILTNATEKERSK